MVSKCANPECSERFLFLHQGKLFQLMPTPEVAATQQDFFPVFHERFWLCDKCCKTMTVVWGGTHAKVMPLPAQKNTSLAASPEHVHFRRRSGKRTAGAESLRTEETASAAMPASAGEKKLQAAADTVTRQRESADASPSGLNDLLQRRPVPDDES